MTRSGGNNKEKQKYIYYLFGLAHIYVLLLHYIHNMYFIFDVNLALMSWDEVDERL